MAVLCPNCGAQFDHTLFAFGRRVVCDCGAVVTQLAPSRGLLEPAAAQTKAEHEAALFSEEQETAEQLARAAERVVDLILSREVEEWEIDLEIAVAREICFQNCPDKLELFDLIYSSRFLRLREQFRNNG